MDADMKQVFFDAETIQKRVVEMGKQIEDDYRGKELVAVCILKGAVLFFSDLLRQINLPLSMDFMSISSYGNSRKSSGVVQIVKDLDNNIAGKHVLIVEDIMDSGQTLSFLKELLAARDPLSLKVACLLDKPSRRVADIQPDYYGFEVPDEFVVGYGLDYLEEYRNLPYVGILRPEIYMDDVESSSDDN